MPFSPVVIWELASLRYRPSTAPALKKGQIANDDVRTLVAVAEVVYLSETISTDEFVENYVSRLPRCERRPSFTPFARSTRAHDGSEDVRSRSSRRHSEMHFSVR